MRDRQNRGLSFFSAKQPLFNQLAGNLLYLVDGVGIGSAIAAESIVPQPFYYSVPGTPQHGSDVNDAETLPRVNHGRQDLLRDRGGIELLCGRLAALGCAVLLLQVELHHPALFVGVVVAKDVLDR